MSYQIRYLRGVERDLSRLPKHILSRIDAAILSLANQPRPQGVIKLAGAKNLYRIRVSDWRIVYEIRDASQIIEIQIVAHRREVYRGI